MGVSPSILQEQQYGHGGNHNKPPQTSILVQVHEE
jgi:hypothetical protein